MLSSISQWITVERHPTLMRFWRTLHPERIILREFTATGCKFDTVTPLESYRVTSLGLEKEFVALLLAEIEPGNVFYDIGSCIGLYALHAAMIGAKVYAFEPDPGFRKRLKHNIKINRLSEQIKVIEWAVANTNDRVVLYTDGIGGNSPSLVALTQRGSVQVETKTIDAGIAEGELNPPEIIKMDIEGSEILALQGMQCLLASNNAPKSIYLELHPAMLAQMNASVDDCLSMIEPHGYVKRYSEVRGGQIHLIYDLERNITG